MLHATRTSPWHVLYGEGVPGKSHWLALVPLLCAVSLTAATEARAAGDCCSQGVASSRPTPPMASGQYENPGLDIADNPYSAVIPQMAPHGGQIATMQRHDFEVVYTRQGIRVYIYLPARQLLNAQAVRGDVVMQVRGNPRPFRYPIRAATDHAGLTSLVVPIDLSRIRDGDMSVTFELVNLPLREEPQARFTQTFALTQPPPSLQVVALTEGDRTLAARQGTCPVLGTPLGQHGPPVKMIVRDRPLFVCCRGCVDKVRLTPDVYLDKAAATTVAYPSRETSDTITKLPPPAARQASERRVIIAEVTAADAQAIQAQGICPVMKTRLGGHGPPIKLLVGGRPLFVCCKGCVQQVKKDPQRYLAKVARPRGVTAFGT